MKEFIKFSKNKVELTIRIVFFKEDNKTIAYTPALELSGEGISLEEAMKDLRAIMRITFEECSTDNTINQMLFELGWRKTSEKERERPAFDVKDLKKRLPPSVKSRLENMSFATA